MKKGRMKKMKRDNVFSSRRLPSQDSDRFICSSRSVSGRVFNIYVERPSTACGYVYYVNIIDVASVQPLCLGEMFLDINSAYVFIDNIISDYLDFKYNR